jgi:O-antigen ligase
MKNPSDTRSGQRIFIWLMLCVLPLIHSSNTVDPDAHLKMLFASVMMLCFITYSVLAGKQVKIVTNPVIISFACLTIYSLTRVIGNNFPDALFEWFQIFLVFTTILVFSGLIERDVISSEFPKAFASLTLILVAVGTKDLAEVIKEGQLMIPGNTYGILSVFGHRNLFAQTLFFALPFSMYGLLLFDNKIWRGLSFAAVLLSVFFLVILSNRATWIALLIGIVLCIVLYIIRVRKGNLIIPAGPGAFKRLLLSVSIGLMISGLFYIKYADVSSVEHHASDIVNFDKGSTKDHLSLWKKSIDLGKEQPLLGNGLASWKIEILKYGNEGLVSENNATFYQTPHNDFLWMYCQEGFIGLMLYILFLVFTAYSIFKKLRLTNDILSVVFFLALQFILVGYLTYSVFSFPKERIEQFLIPGIVAACSVYPSERIIWLKKTKFIVAGIFILLLFSSYISFARYKAEIHLAKALEAKARNNNRLVISEVGKAYGNGYIMDPVSTPLKWYSGSAWFNLGEYKNALVDLRSAYELNPFHIHVLNNLASCYETLGEHQSALFYYREAVKIAPNFEDAWLNLCAVYFNLNDNKNAYEALTHLDVKTKNVKYPQFIMAVLQRRLMDGAEKAGNDKVKELLIQKGSDSAWYIEINRKSRELNRSPEFIVLDYIK